MSELWERFRADWSGALTDALNFYLQNSVESAWVARLTWGQGERVYTAADGEVSTLEVLARVGADQCERLLPRLPGFPERSVPTADQLFRQLEHIQFERQLARIRERVEVAKGQAREQQADITEELTRLELLQETMIRQFYSTRLPFDDDDEAGGTIGVLAKVGPPLRGPGGGRTFEEALAPARNP